MQMDMWCPSALDIVITYPLWTVFSPHRFRHEVWHSSERWKSGALLNTPAVLADMTDGAYFRQSKLAQPARPGEESDLRVGLILYYDDLELNNPLGVTRGKNKVACFYVALANLPAKMRFKHDYIGVLMLVLEKVLKGCGAVRVFAGANHLTGEVITDDVHSFGEQFRATCRGETYVTVRATCALS